MTDQKTVITLLCERAADVDGICDKAGNCTTVDGLKVVKLPCSGMVQPLMIEGAFKAGASGVIVTGCQIGDCYYREGNRMIRERLLGERTPGLKKTVERRRVLALWLSRLQRGKFEAEAKEFVAYIKGLEPLAAAPAAAPKPAPAAKPAAPAVAPSEDKKEDAKAAIESKPTAETTPADADKAAEAKVDAATTSGDKPAEEKKAEESKAEEKKD
ncbi:hydrogenase iron-sulfur subunit [Candidatus Obscuribacterales bacterium]|nr:hydrogenase iron-sulfur subunit [Candidatus Obscuribacterales bacterium]